MATTIYAAKKKYYDLLAADLNLRDDDGVSIVTFGVPSRETRREHVGIGPTVQPDREWAALRRGSAPQDEIYGLVVEIVSNVPGRTQQEATERAAVLFGHVDAVVAANRAPQISVGTIVVAQLRRPDLDEWPFDEGYGAAFTTVLQIHARI